MNRRFIRLHCEVLSAGVRGPDDGHYRKSVAFGKAGISVEATLSKQPLNYIEAPSKKASPKNPTQNKLYPVPKLAFELKRGLKSPATKPKFSAA